MSIGLSMSSVNKIKELADNGDYSLALDILEHQDLSKSLSPQFIRICGEVYYENKKYAEAREALVRAHSMAPMGNKIIYSIIKLYLAMGFRKLAEHYFDIYSFNQNSKDVGSYRIEYMIAKAYRKPVNELYGILVSANDIEHDEEWDYEMLLLHAYIRNKDKYDSGCEEFRAHYRNSSRLYMLDRLMSGEEDLESMIYCFPVSEKKDDDPDQEAVRKFEADILEDDDLRMHPRDAEIRIMVEDDAPVTSSMKLKQMLVRSKDKKEHKKELKLEGQDAAEQKKRSRGLFGFMSKKEEELVEQELEELKSENLDKEQLLEEVVSTDESDASYKKTEMHAMKQEEGEEAAAQDMKEINSESDPENEENYNAEQSDEDNFVIEEEPEEVVMIDADEVEKQLEPEIESTQKLPDGNIEETFDPEFDDGEDGFSDENVEIVMGEEPEVLIGGRSETPIEEEPDTLVDETSVDKNPEMHIDSDADLPADDSLDISAPEESEEREDILHESENGNLQAEEEIPYLELAESSSDVTHGCDETEEKQVAIKGFDFDEAFELLEEFELDESLELPGELQIDESSVEAYKEADQLEDVSKTAEESENDDHPDIEAEADAQKSSEVEAETAAEKIPEGEADSDTEEIPKFETGSDTEEIPKFGTGSDTEGTQEFEVETGSGETPEFDAESDAEKVLEFSAEPSVEDDDELEVEIETETKMGSEIVDTFSEKKSFPIFKSSLFPDYNTDSASLYDLSDDNDIADVIEEKEAIISENLKKEEDLIGETDRLLARIGIKLNSEFNSILDLGQNEDGGDPAGQEHKETERTDNMADDGKKSKKEKKSFRLKD